MFMLKTEVYSPFDPLSRNTRVRSKINVKAKMPPTATPNFSLKAPILLRAKTLVKI